MPISETPPDAPARTAVLLAFPAGRSVAARGEAGPIEAEAARRIARLGLERWLARERLTGLPVPAELRRTKSQIEFAAQALARLDPPPENVQADHFWPA